MFEDFHQLEQCCPRNVQNRLNELKHVRERRAINPESTIYEHIKIVTGRLIRTGDRDLIMAGLFHDLGKLDSEPLNPDSILFSGHERMSCDLVRKNANFVKRFGANVSNVCEIIYDHTRMHKFREMGKDEKKEMRSKPHFQKLRVFNKANTTGRYFKA